MLIPGLIESSVPSYLSDLIYTILLYYNLKKAMFNSVLRVVWLAKGRQFTKEVFTYKITYCELFGFHDVIKWKYYTRYWPFVRGIHRSPVNSPHKGQ